MTTPTTETDPLDVLLDDLAEIVNNQEQGSSDADVMERKAKAIAARLAQP